MTPEEFETMRHESEVRDVYSRIKQQPKGNREKWFAGYIALVIEKRSVEAGERLYLDVCRLINRTQQPRAA